MSLLKKRRTTKSLFLPQLIDSREASWSVLESALEHSGVDKVACRAWVPKPGTRAQQLARLHELYHVKVSPANWNKVTAEIISRAAEDDLLLDAKAVLHISKMMEENRVDWMLWSRHRIDIRSCRDALDWSKMTIPEDEPLEATAWVLQLAWTVWASQGFPKGKVPNPPPARDPDPAAQEYFEQCWKIVLQYNSDLATCILRACMAMYNNPSARVRDQGTMQIASYFQVEPPPELPEEKPEEKEEQEELEKQEKEREKQEQEEREGGTENEWVEIKDKIQLHDHTRGKRRPVVFMNRAYRPINIGFRYKYPTRASLDGYVFGMKAATQGSLMIDFSGSMEWKNDDLLFTLERMPGIYIAGYSGVTNPEYYGRICVIAQNGRFNEFTGIDNECNDANAIDLEALEVLATKPGPRFWLSDGLVVGGKHERKIITDAGPLAPLMNQPFGPLMRTQTPAYTYSYLGHECDLIDMVNKVMKRHDILRVPNAQTMRDLISRKTVTLYKTCTPNDDKMWERYYARSIERQPMRYQL